MDGEGLLRLRLVQAKGERERIAPRIRNSEKFADRRNVGFAVHSAKTFGDVEDDVWSRLPEPLRKILGGFEADDFSEVRERRFYGGNGRRCVPLGELVAGD